MKLFNYLFLAMFVSAISNGIGKAEITCYFDRLQNSQLISWPINEGLIQKGDWHAGHLLGTTDIEGKLMLNLLEGEHNISLYKMTSSHSQAQSEQICFNMTTNKTTILSIHIAPFQVSINAHQRTEMGQALQIIGETNQLGEWRIANKMNYVGSGVWNYQKNLPIGAEFKIMFGPWVYDQTLPVEKAIYMKGANIVIPPPQYLPIKIDVYPQF